MKKKIFALSFVYIGSASFLIGNQSFAYQSSNTIETTCGTTVCVTSNSKNRFLARGCKPKTGFSCVSGGPGLPDIL